MTWALPAGLVGRAFENIGVSLQCGEGHSIPVAQVWLIQPVRWLISSDAVAQKLRAGNSPHPIFACRIHMRVFFSQIDKFHISNSFEFWVNHSKKLLWVCRYEWMPIRNEPIKQQKRKGISNYTEKTTKFDMPDTDRFLEVCLAIYNAKRGFSTPF